MRALKYFDPEVLVGIEEALFKDYKSFDFCLIDESSKQFYIGTTSSIAGLVSRLRSGVMRVEYPVLAHFLQQTAKTSQMSSWVLAVFKEGYETSRVAGTLIGFDKINKALPFEVNGKENALVYRIEHTRYGVRTHCVTSKEPTRSTMVGLARHRFRRLLEKSDAGGEGFEKDFIEAIRKVIEHGSAEEWQWHVMGGQKDLDYRAKTDLALILGSQIY